MACRRALRRAFLRAAMQAVAPLEAQGCEAVPRRGTRAHTPKSESGKTFSFRLREYSRAIRIVAFLVDFLPAAKRAPLISWMHESSQMQAQLGHFYEFRMVATPRALPRRSR